MSGACQVGAAVGLDDVGAEECVDFGAVVVETATCARGMEEALVGPAAQGLVGGVEQAADVVHVEPAGEALLRVLEGEERTLRLLKQEDMFGE